MKVALAIAQEPSETAEVLSKPPKHGSRMIFAHDERGRRSVYETTDELWRRAGRTAEPVSAAPHFMRSTSRRKAF